MHLYPLHSHPAPCTLLTHLYPMHSPHSSIPPALSSCPPALSSLIYTPCTLILHLYPLHSYPYPPCRTSLTPTSTSREAPLGYGPLPNGVLGGHHLASTTDKTTRTGAVCTVCTVHCTALTAHDYTRTGAVCTVCTVCTVLHSLPMTILAQVLYALYALYTVLHSLPTTIPAQDIRVAHGGGGGCKEDAQLVPDGRGWK
jgi:hypothetical protein